MAVIYNLIFIGFAFFYIPVFLFRKRKRKGLALRLGWYPKDLAARLKSGPRNIWVHAVSVGEVMAVSSLTAGLRSGYPGQGLVITTVTETGNSVAKKLAGRQEIVSFLPFDISFIVRRVISYLRPALLIITETELWPNLIREADNNKIPVILVNGRISDRSFKGYSLIRFMLKPVLKKISFFLMQTGTDRDKIVSLGAVPSKVKVCGNMKFDSAISITVSEEEKKALRSLLTLKEGERLLVAGSTHPGEEEIIVSGYINLKNRHKGLRLLIAPRHIERTPELENILKQHGLTPVKISQLTASTNYQLPTTNYNVFILDTIGQLKRFYSIAEIVFVGGSLVKRGGQNMIEPAVFARPILFGPYTFNFCDVASAFLKEEGAIMVKDKRTLEKAVTSLLEDPAWARRLGQKAKEIVRSNQGATEMTLDAIREIILTNKVQP